MRDTRCERDRGSILSWISGFWFSFILSSSLVFSSKQWSNKSVLDSRFHFLEDTFTFTSWTPCLFTLFIVVEESLIRLEFPLSQHRLFKSSATSHPSFLLERYKTWLENKNEANKLESLFHPLPNLLSWNNKRWVKTYSSAELIFRKNRIQNELYSVDWKSRQMCEDAVVWRWSRQIHSSKRFRDGQALQHNDGEHEVSWEALQVLQAISSTNIQHGSGACETSIQGSMCEEAGKRR